MLHFIVGDIHGCIDELILLEQLIERVSRRRKQVFKLISVGDLVDRGPDSKAVVQRFMDGEKRGSHLAIMGNHESNFLEYLRNEHSKWFRKNRLRLPKWVYTLEERHSASRWAKGISLNEHPIISKAFFFAQGGIETLHSYGVNPKNPSSKELPPEHIRYLSQLPLFYEHKNFIVSHALPKKRDFMAVRRYLRGKKSLDLEIKKACDSLYWNRDMTGVKKIGHKVLISGHTPYKIPRRREKSRVIQVDTHCFKGRRLTAYCPELDRFFSVKAKKLYYGKT
ncbi:MAG: hypothetical protein COT73_12310 [Bdellovibrio sp. CG10_big_fil_rev_8_21_14_0_10_47_8]|nr:MAG: hypothetical protein COT73_12310 [Bdellovibrio sp. CG10_big_fil_rev_8_21_14_0_10_47_8]